MILSMYRYTLLSCVNCYLNSQEEQKCGYFMKESSIMCINLISKITSKISTLSTLMSTTVDILSFYWHLYNLLVKVKCAFNFETLLYVAT